MTNIRRVLENMYSEEEKLKNPEIFRGSIKEKVRGTHADN